MPKRRMDLEEMEALLGQGLVGHLGLSRDGEPYVVPLNYVYEKGKIYFHGKKGGLKMDCLRLNPRVCFEVDELISVVKAPSACKFTTEYRSVIAYGRACLVEEGEEKQRVASRLTQKYASGASFEPPSLKAVEEIAIVEIEVREMTGKANLRKSPAT